MKQPLPSNAQSFKSLLWLSHHSIECMLAALFLLAAALGLQDPLTFLAFDYPVSGCFAQGFTSQKACRARHQQIHLLRLCQHHVTLVVFAVASSCFFLLALNTLTLHICSAGSYSTPYICPLLSCHPSWHHSAQLPSFCKTH